MNATRACQCILTLTLVSIAVPIRAPVSAASDSGARLSTPNGSPERKKPATPAHPNGSTRETTPTGKTGQSTNPPNRAQEVEERVRSGQMEQPIAQGEISERLNRLDSGLQSLSDGTETKHSNR